MTTQLVRIVRAQAILAAAAVGLPVGATHAGIIMSFGFTDLSTSFDTNSGQFAAEAVDSGQLQTGGDVTRLVGGGGSATYGSGFVSFGTQADFQLGMSITNIVGNTADGAGSLTITDANGDLISGSITGDWELIGGAFYVFSGLLEGVAFTETSGDGLFNGPSGGSFSTTFESPPPYSGAAVYLYFGNFGGFFDESFDGLSGQISGEIIPAAGPSALLGLSALLACRRRRPSRTAAPIA